MKQQGDRNRSTSIALGAALLALACSTTEPGVLCNDLDVQVTPTDAGPLFAWDPGPCRIGALVVNYAEGPDQVLWSLQSDPGEDTIEGPVTYGIPPAGTGVSLPAEPLAEGVTYVVQLMVTGEEGAGLSYAEVGRATFVHADSP